MEVFFDKKMMFNFTRCLLLIFISVIFSSCMSKLEVDAVSNQLAPANGPSGVVVISTPSSDTSIDPSLAFSGMLLFSSKTDTQVTLHWVAHPDAVAYDVYNTVSGVPVYMTPVLGQATDQVTLTGLIPGATYKFRVRMVSDIKHFILFFIKKFKHQTYLLSNCHF